MRNIIKNLGSIMLLTCLSLILLTGCSIGGDSDTIAAIAGSIAEVIYPVPQGLRGRVIDGMDRFLLNTIVESVDFLYRRFPA